MDRDQQSDSGAHGNTGAKQIHLADEDLAKFLQATHMLEPLTPDARADLIADLLVKQAQHEVVHVRA